MLEEEGNLQRSSVGGIITLRNKTNSLGVPDSAVGERTVVEVRETVDLAVTAVLVTVGAAVVAVAADLVCVAKSDSVASLDVCDGGTNSLDDSDTLVTQNDAAGGVQLVGTTDTRVCGLDKDLVVLELTLDVVRDDLALWGAAEDLVGDHFVYVYMCNKVDMDIEMEYRYR